MNRAVPGLSPSPFLGLARPDAPRAVDDTGLAVVGRPVRTFLSTRHRRRFQNELYAQYARIGRAFSDAHRIELLDVLAQGERSVAQLASDVDLTLANTSRHLQVLRQAELVARRREGSQVRYALAGPEVLALWQSLRAAGETRLAEIGRLVGRFLSAREQMELVTPEELRCRLATGRAILLDVRPILEYRQGHIDGALSLPVEILAERLTEIPGEHPIVAYGRGPYCLFADEAVELLRAHGLHAGRLTVGYPDWQAAGLPIAIDDRLAPAGGDG